MARGMMEPLWDDPGAGSGGGAGASGNAGAGASGANNGPASGAGSAGSSGASTQYRIEDDPRYKGTIADLQKERAQRQALAAEKQRYETELEQARRQVAALTGVRTPSKEEADLDAVKERLVSMFPVLAKLSDEQVDKLLEVGERGDALEQASQQTWVRHGKQMLGNAYVGIEKELGSALSDRQKAQVNALYVARAERDKEFLARHDAGDPKLTEEFVKEFLEDWFEPVRRKTTAAEAGRFRPVPGAKERTMPMVGEKPIDVTDDKAVADFLAKSRQGRFGRGR